MSTAFNNGRKFKRLTRRLAKKGPYKPPQHTKYKGNKNVK